MDLFDSEIVDLTLDGADLDRTPYQRETVRDGANVLIKRRFAGGLEVNTEGRLIAAFGAYEWRNTLVNRGAVCSGKISQLWDCACLLALPHDENRRRTAYRPREAECAMICAPSGSTWSEREFFDEPEAAGKSATRLPAAVPPRPERRFSIFTNRGKVISSPWAGAASGALSARGPTTA